MSNSIVVESLSVISHASVPVVTTELLANLYGTDTDNVKKNFARNGQRFTEGKHYFKLTGNELRSFKHKVTDCPFVKIASNVRHLMLWTERGAARHAKMLETDQAWEVFEKLEDCYFNQKVAAQVTSPCPAELAIDLLNIDLHICIRNGQVEKIENIGPDMYIGEVSTLLSELRQRGWIVIRRDLLAQTLAAF